MAYEVTATRKRPQVFEKLVGQEFVVSTIENAIESGRIAHAYLFSGPRGVGKTSSARLLAKALNCEKGPTAHPCGVCDSCREITSGSSVDVIEIDGASNTSVNDIRVIKDEVLFPPQSSRYKIYIIDEVHMLSNSAFNALLKTIEEPPEYIIFIFATTELQKVPATIRSRCQQFHFQLIGLNDIKKCLSEACQEMNIQADEDALFWIAKEAAGSMRDAYTLFDQVASFSGSHITLAGIKDKLGLVGSDQIASIISSSVKGNRKEALETLDSILAKGVSVDQCLRDFSEFFRSLLFLKEGVDSEEILNIRAGDVPPEIISALTTAQCEAALRYVMNIYREVRYSISPRFELELFVSRLSSLPFLTSPEELVAKLEALKSDIAQGKATVVKEVRTVSLPSSPNEGEKEKESRPFDISPSDEKKTEADKVQQMEASRDIPAPPDDVIQSTPSSPLMYNEEEDDEADSGEDDVTADAGEDSYPAEEHNPHNENKEKNPQDYMSKLDEMTDEANGSDIFGLGSCFAEIYDIRMENGDMVLVTASGYAHKFLNENISEVRQIIRNVTGFSGHVSAILQAKPQVMHNPLLDKVAKAFRGQIITLNQ